VGFTLYHSDMLPGLPGKMRFDLDGITVGELFTLLANQYGDQALTEVLDKSGKLHREAMVVINGSILRQPLVLSTVIPAESEVLVTVLMAGG